MLRTLLLVLLMTVLAGCNVYHPLKDGVGYTELPVGRDAFEVTYVGTGDMSVAEARDYCLTRAAELAVLHGTPYFQIGDEHVYVGTGSQYVPGNYYATPVYYGRRGWHGYYRNYYEPGYVQTYTIPEVTMRIELRREEGPQTVPARYLIEEAMARKIELTPGVVERAQAMPSGPATIPAPPIPMPKPEPGATVPH